MKLGWSIVLGGAFIVGSLILGTYLQSSKRANAKVTVKGLSEQTVKADLSWWSLSTQVSGNSIEEVKSNIAFSTKRINAFLASQGFKQSEYKTDNISVYSNNSEKRVTHTRAI